MTEEEIKDSSAENAEELSENVSAGEEKKEAEKKDKKHKGACRELEAKVIELESENGKLKQSLSEAEDKYMRRYAEYDNFRKRTAKEKESIYGDAYSDAVTNILPIIDTLEIAAGCSGDKITEGVRMTLKQFTDVLEKLGIEEIHTEKGDEFDPAFHNAVMSEDSAEVASGCVANVLRKGYKKGDKVFRYVMVSVAN